MQILCLLQTRHFGVKERDSRTQRILLQPNIAVILWPKQIPQNELFIHYIQGNLNGPSDGCE